MTRSIRISVGNIQNTIFSQTVSLNSDPGKPKILSVSSNAANVVRRISSDQAAIQQPELNGHRQSCPQTTVVCTLSADTLHTRTTLKFETADTSQTQTYYHFKNADTEQTQTFKYFKSEDTQQTQTHISSD